MTHQYTPRHASGRPVPEHEASSTQEAGRAQDTGSARSASGAQHLVTDQNPATPQSRPSAQVQPALAAGPEPRVGEAAPAGAESSETLVAREKVAWGALWAVVIGFFMILVDSTIVSTAMPAIMEHFETGINNVVWVTSAYLLAYAVPLLITGRLGDKYGPRTIYLVGLVVFTLSSLWCGMAPSIEQLILARVFQGIGAALMTPQSMSVITRLFPPHRRGAAMGVWGSVAGVASLVGPILGGVLVDGLGWEWIFFVNIPVGILAFWRAWVKVPKFEHHERRMDWVGVVLSAVAMFLIVFGIQEGHGHDWGTIWGEVTVPEIIAAGVVLMALFVLWQRFTASEPLVPLRLFTDRNFSLGNGAIALVGLMISSFALPYMLYLQLVRDMTPTESALMIAPMAVVSGALSPVVGKRITISNAPFIAAAGLFLNAAGLFLYAYLMDPDTSLWVLLVPSVLLGVGGSCMWAPISVTTTRDLAPRSAGAGSGIYNTTRQVGAVLGSALIAMMMENRLSEHLPAAPHGQGAAGGGEAAAMGSGGLPAFLHDGYSTAMGESMWLPAAALVLGMVLVLCFRRRPLPQERKVQA